MALHHADLRHLWIDQGRSRSEDSFSINHDGSSVAHAEQNIDGGRCCYWQNQFALDFSYHGP